MRLSEPNIGSISSSSNWNFSRVGMEWVRVEGSVLVVKYPQSPPPHECVVVGGK